MDTALKQVTQIVLEVDRDLVDFYHIGLASPGYLTGVGMFTEKIDMVL
jgi:hypothetical protein